MDFLDPAKKKSHLIRLFIGYILVAIAIAIATLILLYQSYGYDVDRKTGALIQNGLLFVASKPGGADIHINGSVQRNRTDARFALPAGQYTIELKRSGYRSWQRAVALEGGQVQRLDYPFLFPEKLVTEDVQLYGGEPRFASASPDRRWLVVGRPGKLAEFDIFDLNDSNKEPVPLILPAGLLRTAGDNHDLELVEWADNDRHFVLAHRFGDDREFLLLDREAPASSINLNQTFGLNPQSLTLRDKHPQRFYILDKTAVLSTADLQTRAATPLLNSVLAFKSDGDAAVVYVTNENAPPGKVRAMVRDQSGSFVLHDLAPGPRYLTDIARFDGQRYVAVGSGNEGRVYVYQDPVSVLKRGNGLPAVPVSVLKVTDPRHLSFSLNNRFVVAQRGEQFAVYDVEADRYYEYDVKLPISADTKANWMDGHRLTVYSEGKAAVFDYEGTNLQPLSAITSTSPAFFDPGFKGLYSLAPSVTVPSRFALTRTSLETP